MINEKSSMAGTIGFAPILHESKSCVLLLHHAPVYMGQVASPQDCEFAMCCITLALPYTVSL